MTLAPLIRSIPLWAYFVPRRAVTRLPRGHILRSACVPVVKVASRAWRGHLARVVKEIRPLDVPTLSFAPTDSIDAVFWGGVQGYEGLVSDVWKTLCSGATSVLEIGGNIGLFTVIGAQAAAGEYTVVEPIAVNAAVLHGNLARNGLNRVEVLEAAVISDAAERMVQIIVPDEGRDSPVGAHLVGAEIGERTTMVTLTVRGVPMQALIGGRDVIKIDAEGIEADLLASVYDTLVEQRPALLLEVLPEAQRLAAMIGRLAREAEYVIAVLPEYGDQRLVVVPPGRFTADLPQRFRSKDVVLSRAPLPFPQDKLPA